jgi:hypothetical protein
VSKASTCSRFPDGWSNGVANVCEKPWSNGGGCRVNDDVLRLNNILGDIIKNYGSLSRIDTVNLSIFLLERGVVLGICSCGKTMSRPQCGVCDNDE